MLAGNWFGKKRYTSNAKTSPRPLEKGPRRKASSRKSSARGRNLRVEGLEDRRMLATYVVNNLGDLDANEAIITGSLRQAINLSNASQNETDTIVFADFLFTHPTTRVTTPGTIALDGRPNGRQLTITDEVNILGPGASKLTISGTGDFRIFETNIDSDEQVRAVTIGGVTLSGGALIGTDDSDDNRGGAIFNREALTLIETDITNNRASWGGGAVYSPIGAVNVTRSLVRNNTSGGGGGAILLGDGDDEERPGLTVSNSTFTGNQTFTVGTTEPQLGYGGAIYNRSGITSISNSTFIANSASVGGGGVATNGVPLDDTGAPPPAIVTRVTHSVLYENTGASNSTDNQDDIYAVRVLVEDDMVTPLAPTLLIDGDGLGFNFIGRIGATEFWDPADAMNPGNSHFYQLVVAGDEEEGITWTLANRFTTFGQAIRNPAADPLPPLQGSHFATPSSAEENQFVFENLVDNPLYWSVFQPEDEGEPPMTPPPDFIGPWIGARQIDMEMEPAGGFEWVTAPEEDFSTYQNWAPGEPNDGARPGAEEPGPTEAFVHYFNGGAIATAGTWGDAADEPEGDGQSPFAYVIEYDQGTNFFGVNPLLTELGDFGGATQVFYPNSASGSPLIDAGNPGGGGGFDQRGIHFSRVFGGVPDIGAVEVQSGLFTVDTLFDEADGQYTAAYNQDGVLFTDPTYSTRGDFALREALEFSEKNPEFDTITFSTNLLNLVDPTSSSAPTILLKLRSDLRSALAVSRSVDIIGPSGFELEIDAVGNDPTPTVNNADGTRIFSINDGQSSFFSQVSISGLTLLGGDVVGEGGAILNREDLTLDRVNIKQNFASNGGGGISTSNGELMVSSSALFANDAGLEGGALKVAAATPGNLSKATVRNSTVSGNSATFGAGIMNYDGELLVEFSTITDNTGVNGAGIANRNKPNTFTQLRSSIVSANEGTDVQILQSAVPNVQSLGFNLIGSGNAISVFVQPGDQPGVNDPMISPLGKDGGFIPVHRLLPGSPAVDTGESTAVAGVGNVPLYDQRGNPFTRVFDGVQDTKDRIDIGAYELQGTTFIVDTPFDENDGLISTGFLSLREAIELSNANPLPDVIMFDPAVLANQTIQQSAKNSGALLPGTPTDMRITDSVSIVGLGEGLLTFQGGARTDVLVTPPLGEPIGISRFFTIDDGNNASDIVVSISGVTFTGSINTTQVGAVIKSHEDLTISDVTFTANSTLGEGKSGGALYQRYGSLSLDDVTLTANTTNGVDADGGAVYIRDADATILNSVISGNSTSQTLGSGGGLYIRGGTLNMTYTTVSSNLAPGGEADGGGIFGFESVLNLNNSYISGNSMTGSNSEGAGIFAKNSTLTLTDSFVSLNKTTGTQSEGAGIYLSGGSATIERSSISLNTTTGLVATGGGIAVIGGDLLLHESTLDRNSTSGSNAPGGGIHNLGGDVTIVDSTISGNKATGTGSRGGGVFSNTALVGSEGTLIVNSTVSGNSTNDSGGGVFNAAGATDIRHSTITKNSVPFFGKGAGVASLGNAATTSTRVYSTIIAGNIASSDPSNPVSDVDSPAGTGQNTFVSLGYNVIGRGLTLALNAFNSIGDQTLVDDPMLGLLTFNGGLTFAHAPLEGSPVINAGNPSDTPGFGQVPTFDQRGSGFPRLLGGRLDVGAIESTFAPADSADFDSDGDVDGTDFLTWQRGFNILSPSRSDGDADLDGNVNNVDLGVWETTYGTTGSLAAVASGDGEEQFLAALQVESEPQAALPVLSSEASPTGESLPTGLILEPITLASDNSAEKVDTDAAVEEPAVVRDRLFAALSQRSEYRLPSVESESADDASGEELQLSVEDQVFDWFGA